MCDQKIKTGTNGSELGFINLHANIKTVRLALGEQNSSLNTEAFKLLLGLDTELGDDHTICISVEEECRGEFFGEGVDGINTLVVTILDDGLELCAILQTNEQPCVSGDGKVRTR